MKSKVFFIPASREEIGRGIPAINKLFQGGGFGDCFEARDLTGIKTHFGEKGNDTHIPWQWVKAVATLLKRAKARPFVTDTNVLYKSQRDNAVNHLELAHRHGFTHENLGVPVLIADGLIGSSERTVPIPGELYQQVSLSSVAVEAQALVILSHVTGHMNTALGGTIKNMGMGFASRKGKLKQHSTSKPLIDPRACTGCGVCIEWCPEDAIAMQGETAVIDQGSCIGCGECLAVCRFDAVRHNWQVGENELQKHMAEHAFGIVQTKRDKIVCFNFLTAMTRNCDCVGGHQDPVIPDIGILASTDPVAVDAAALDLIREITGKTLESVSFPDIDPWAQIRHGEKIGMGNAEYDLIAIDV